jgi:hypothetical protein
MRPLEVAELAAVRDAVDQYGGFLGLPAELREVGEAQPAASRSSAR